MLKLKKSVRRRIAALQLPAFVSPYDVAKMLGDTIETVEKHYTPFVRELRERVRRILETGTGLEELAVMTPETPQADLKKPN